MNTASPTSPICQTFSTPGSPGSVMNEQKPTSTAAAPTNECSMATSSGISVIFTCLALKMPMAPPMASATTMSRNVTQAPGAAEPNASFAGLPASANEPSEVAAKGPGNREATTAITTVAIKAMAMPAMPAKLPLRADFCFESPAKAKTNSSAAAM